MARQLRIGIIGGGPGGLALAQGLRKAGLDPVVFEKNRARSDYVQGFRLRVRRRGLSALEALLPEALYQAVLDTAGRAPSETLQFDELLRPLDLRQDPDPAADDALIEMSLSRITLRQVLLTGLDDIIAYGRTFASYTENADGRSRLISRTAAPRCSTCSSVPTAPVRACARSCCPRRGSSTPARAALPGR